MIYLILIALIYFLWNLLVQGMLWKIITGIFGWFGMYWALMAYLPISRNTCLILAGGNFSWAHVVPTIIVLMAMLYTKE